MSHRELKDPLYAQFARIGHAVASPKRIEFLDLLSQGEKTVEQLSDQSATPVKNTSAHLRVLRQARLVETRRSGTFVYYRLAGDDVFRFVRDLESLGRSRLAEVEQVAHLYIDGRDELEPVSIKELRRRMREGDITVIDVRPEEEYLAGHIPGALLLNPEQYDSLLPQVLSAWSPERKIVVYCSKQSCGASREVARRLRGEAQLKNVFVLNGGWETWQASRH